MSKAKLVITAVVVEGRSQSEVAAAYGVSKGWVSKGWVSKGWVSKLIARYRAEGDAAFQARSRRPRSSPKATDPATVCAGCLPRPSHPDPSCGAGRGGRS